MEKRKKEQSVYRRFLDDIYTREDASRFIQDIHEPEKHPELIDLADEVWEESAFEQLTTNLEREKYKQEAHHLLTKIERRKKTYWPRIGAVAASIAIIVSLSFGGLKYFRHIEKQDMVYLEASTSYGERKQVLLPDGTKLILNSCSYVKYPQRFIGEERRVELEGEGYFNVARNEAMPFIVKTSRFDVRVLGTSFDVKAYQTDEMVSVSVESGKVQVDLPNAMMRLVAHEQIFINTVSDEYNKRKEERQVATWIKGGLRFDRTPVHDVAKELERVYNCRISFAPDQTFHNLISGEHDNKDLESVLRSLEFTSGIKYKKEGRNILLYK